MILVNENRAFIEKKVDKLREIEELLEKRILAFISSRINDTLNVKLSTVNLCVVIKECKGNESFTVTTQYLDAYSTLDTRAELELFDVIRLCFVESYIKNPITNGCSVIFINHKGELQDIMNVNDDLLSVDKVDFIINANDMDIISPYSYIETVHESNNHNIMIKYIQSSPICITSDLIYMCNMRNHDIGKMDHHVEFLLYRALLSNIELDESTSSYIIENKLMWRFNEAPELLTDKTIIDMVNKNNYIRLHHIEKNDQLMKSSLRTLIRTGCILPMTVIVKYTLFKPYLQDIVRFMPFDPIMHGTILRDVIDEGLMITMLEWCKMDTEFLIKYIHLLKPFLNHCTLIKLLPIDEQFIHKYRDYIDWDIVIDMYLEKRHRIPLYIIQKHYKFSIRRFLRLRKIVKSHTKEKEGR